MTEKLPNIYMTSDLHFGHQNICQYENRPFGTSNHMDNTLIKNWNRTVKKEDTVYVLGDFTLNGSENISKVRSITRKLNGRKILIYGNHDRLSPQQYIECGFHATVYPYLEFQPGWLLMHDPSVANQLENYEICLCGHVHSLFFDIPDKRILNVGTDLWNYKPVSLKEIIKVKNNWNKEK